MHIGIDARLPYYRLGGISRYILQLLEALAAIDTRNQYTVFHSFRDNVDHTPQQANFKRRNVYTPCHHRFERWSLSLELLAQDLDILHSPDFIPPLRGARRHVITVHDLNFLYYPQFLTNESRRYYSNQISWAVRHADAIIADSERTRQDLIRDLHVDPATVAAIHLAADPSFAAVATTAGQAQIQKTLDHYGLQPGFILFVGTIEPRKNITGLLDAYTLLRQQSKATPPLVLVGAKGWLFDEIFERIEVNELESFVRHLEKVPDSALAHLYLAAGLMALPSYYEGFGLPVLEAMHCRCPVIVSNRAALPEVVGAAGILLDPQDVDTWALSMHHVLHDENLREQMVEAGLEHAQKFSWTRTAEATWNVYEQLANA